MLKNENAKAGITLVLSILAALVTALGTGTTDFGDISLQGWLGAALAVLGSAGLVYWTENGPYAPTIKAIMSFLTAGIASLIVALDDWHITQAEWLTAIIAGIVASGLVYQAPGPAIKPIPVAAPNPTP